MRIVCVADTHMFHADFKGERAIPDGDVFIHAGDMGRAGDEEELTEVARWLRALPHRHKIVVAGNHDFLFQTEPAKARSLFAGLTYLEDAACTIDGVTFYGSPWTPIFFDWAFMLPRNSDAIAAKWALIPERGVDVLITHGPPYGILDDARRYRDGDSSLEPKPPRPVGCEALRERVRVVRPRVHLFGHIHNNQGVVEEDGTRFVNCTTNESEAPATVIDL